MNTGQELMTDLFNFNNRNNVPISDLNAIV